MLCACSGEQFRFEEADFSVCGVSSRTGEWESRFEDSQVEDVESTLKETVSLNYEEARALLGRLEFQKGNLDAALQVFRGIDIAGLKPKLTRAIVERSRRRRARSKMEILHASVMSMHSVSLLLEAILLKSKALEGLGLVEGGESSVPPNVYLKNFPARECGIILDIAEAAFPDGMGEGLGEDCKLQEMLHQALLLLPGLWKVAGSHKEAVDSHRRVLSRPWNLPPQKLATVQKCLAGLLLHGGAETTEVEEALLLLFILSKNMAEEEIIFDPEVVYHLSFALSIYGLPENLAEHIERTPPGGYCRRERWYLLALCYSAAGHDEAGLNLLRKATGSSERRRPPICRLSCWRRSFGVGFSRRVVELAGGRPELAGVAHHLLGISCGRSARSSSSDVERSSFYEQSQRALGDAAAAHGDDPEVMLTLGWEFALRRSPAAALMTAAKYLDSVAGSSVRGWELLVLAAASEGNLEDAKGIVDLALEETGEGDQLGLLRLKGLLHSLRGEAGQAIETYRLLLAVIQARNQNLAGYPHPKEAAAAVKDLEMDAWLDLAGIYRDLASWSDSEICLLKAKSISRFSSRCWHERGKLLEARGLLGDALSAFHVSSTLDPHHAPSMVATAALLAGLGRRARPAARSLLMNALQLDPMSHVAWLSLGRVYKMEGSLLQAADCFQAAHDLMASSPSRGSSEESINQGEDGVYNIL
ncbi:unnamed protein product [Spirodela intermedia]|uniref:Uncharacterized protein n=1 Tax=Spirodela intermedia TaxID=51605 RepID=A0A7I8JB22_SPIIN|nr:unnamed protein product [Spirodela intermedia]CAA6667418.1 unnamed protein product [Spirodela intermedia]